jgi:hypothetical protein
MIEKVSYYVKEKLWVKKWLKKYYVKENIMRIKNKPSIIIRENTV